MKTLFHRLKGEKIMAHIKCAYCGMEIPADETGRFYLSESEESMCHEMCLKDYLQYLFENEQIELDFDDSIW